MVFKVGYMLGLFKVIQNTLVVFLAAIIIFGCESADPTDSHLEEQDGNQTFQRSEVFKKTNWFPDSEGDRYFLPSGFVVNMEDDIYYKQNDFNRIARYGANTVVIRLGIGHVGGWPGYDVDQQYLDKLDSYVNYAGKVGLKTVFKMTIYDIRGKNKVQNIWGKLFKNNNNEQKYYLEGWQRLWTKYANEPSVIGYDLVNEPKAGEKTNKSDTQVTKTQLTPLYRKLMVQLRSINPEKWVLYQPLVRSDRKLGELAFAEFEERLEYKKLVYAPHAYYDDLEMLKKAVNRHTREAEISGAKMMMGEWGRQTPASVDTSLQEQIEYYKLYAESVSLYDQENLGGIKAWFRGTPSFIHHNGNIFTWSIFSDTSGVGTTERKYIVDAVNRVKPLYTNSPVESYEFDFATRVFDMTFNAKELSGITEIYVPKRHYPDGFTVDINNIRLVRDSQSEGGLTVVNGGPELVPSSFSYDEKNERLLITTWDNQSQQNELKISPGLYTNNMLSGRES